MKQGMDPINPIAAAIAAACFGTSALGLILGLPALHRRHPTPYETMFGVINALSAIAWTVIAVTNWR